MDVNAVTQFALVMLSVAALFYTIGRGDRHDE